MKKLKFNTYVFDMRLNNLAVARYDHENSEKVTLRVENINDKILSKLTFKNSEEANNFIDEHCDSGDQFYNRARALNNLIDAIS